MDKDTRNNRSRLVGELARIFPDVKIEKIRADVDRLGKIGATAHRHAERMCGESEYYNANTGEDGEDKRKDNFYSAAKKITDEYGLKVVIRGDPRGFVFYLYHPKLRGNTWGGDEHGYGLN